MVKALFVLLLGAVPSAVCSSSEDDPVIDACIERASIKYQVPELLIRATIDVESNWRAEAINHSNQNGTADYGLMQINSWWLTELKRYGIDRQNIRDPCVNIHVGTWILASNIRSKGITEMTLGAYNAGFSKDKVSARKRYVTKLAKAMHRRTASLNKR